MSVVCLFVVYCLFVSYFSRGVYDNPFVLCFCYAMLPSLHAAVLPPCYAAMLLLLCCYGCAAAADACKESASRLKLSGIASGSRLTPVDDSRLVGCFSISSALCCLAIKSGKSAHMVHPKSLCPFYPLPAPCQFANIHE